MAFDQTSIPNDLRPSIVVRTVADEPRGYFPAAPTREIVSPESVPVYYPAPISDHPAGFLSLGYANAVAPGVATPWAVPVFPSPSPAVGFGYNPNPGHCAPSSNGRTTLPSDSQGNQTSDEGTEDSVSRKKVKFLCSFGGKILPRPSDSVLRYVGGHTRIISVKRDLSFTELVQKMTETYGQPVYIKYQLPDEDLDALVSVSCPDDLENMMDEFEKLDEKCADGSAKLRLFLFSPSELDPSGMVQFGDLHDTDSQRYVDAVNGVADVGGVGIARKESIASVTSTRSDFSGGNEAVVEVSRKHNSGYSDETSPRLVCLDHPVRKSTAPIETEPERSVAAAPPPPPATTHVYTTQPDYHLQHQMGFPGPQLVARQFVPSQSVVQPILQPQQQQMRYDGFVDERSYGPRVVQIPVEQSYAPYQVQVSNYGNYGWHQQVPMQDQRLIYSEQPPPVTFSNAIPMTDCYMCQNALPHAHSDPVTTQRDPLSDSNSIHNGLRLDDHSRSQPVARAAVTGFSGENPLTQTSEKSVQGRPPIEYSNAFPVEARIEALSVGLEALPSDHLSEVYYGGVNAPSSLLPHGAIGGDIQDSSNSLFSDQDPWNLRQDPPFPPPRSAKSPSKNDPFIVPKDLFIDNTVEEGLQQSYLGSDQSQSTRGTGNADEQQIRNNLQAVAEGVAASVFQSNTSSNPELGITTEAIHDENKAEDVKTKLPERTHMGFPVSDGIGRLQIIKNIDLEELRELGSGTFGTVYHGKWRGTDVAIKRINDRCFAGKPSEQERMRDDFWNEAIKLADLHHPNVLAFYGLVLDGPGGSVATVTEYMVNGSLRNALQKNEKSLDKRKRLLIAMDVAFGMEYLHGKNIVHFDLKSDNLLVNLRDPHRPICKVGDLGLSKVKCQTLISGGVRGTLPWMAPELLNGSSNLVSEKVDVFSFGIVMWELLTGEEPYADLHYGAIIGGIVSNTLRPPVPESCDLEWKSLMEKCWSAEPSERLSFAEIANQLRSMAAKIPPKGHNTTQQQNTTTQN